MAVARRDVEVVIRKVLGFEEATLVTAAMNCVMKGYSSDKTTRKLADFTGEREAKKLSYALQDLIRSHRKKRGDRDRDREHERGYDSSEKRSRLDDSHEVNGRRGDGQKEPRRKEQAVLVQKQTTAAVEVKAEVKSEVVGDGAGAVTGKQTRMQQLQASIQARLAAVASAGKAQGISVILPNNDLSSLAGPSPLILDDLGRAIDREGKAISYTPRQPTLKANIRAARREQFKQQLQEKPPDLQVEATSKFFDQRLGNKTVQRVKKKFQFYDKGKFEALAERMKAKAQLEKLQEEISDIARKTGIQSATKLALIKPKKDYDEEVPEIEWWDAVILKDQSYEAVAAQTPVFQGITHLVEHPIQLDAPTDTKQDDVVLPMYLTKKERKKLRRQNRREAWKEKQEKIRLGLEPAPDPKVKMSNMMRVLGQEAVQDPTKIEAHVRAQMAKRLKAHEDANKARQLTAEQRKEKKIKKLKDDTSNEVHVAIYRIKDLSNPSKKFKIEANCTQLYMTGLVVLYKDCNVVVVEGGETQQKKFKRLMTHRIHWDEDVIQANKSVKASVQEKGKQEDGEMNQCILIWEGTTKYRAFHDFKFKLCPTEGIAREHFRKQSVENYWELAYSYSVIEENDTL